MDHSQFTTAFQHLTGNQPFPWQWELYSRWFSVGKFPGSCNLPTGLGKTSVVAVWLIALSTDSSSRVPRRLIYVVNRRTVVDQTTAEAEKLRQNAERAGVLTPAISTLRGQFADNREWSADPSRPAIIVGTVDMIGSRLLFCGYGVGFKSRPLHAGFLGQDALLVHDEAHLEPAFQELLVAIEKEQQRCNEFARFWVMELSATPRGGGELFTLTQADHDTPEVNKRVEASKAIVLHENHDEKKLSDQIAELTLKHRDSNKAVLVFVRKVDDVDKIVKKLPKESTEQLTGTLRGLERDCLVLKPIFQRFLPESSRDPQVTPAPGTVYLVCTSAGEVGVNLSADHLVCDLSTFDSMAQRFGRVNRFGNCHDTRIDVVHPQTFEDDELETRRQLTLDLLRQLKDASPNALNRLDENHRREAFAPTPTILPVTDILFDAWALTSIHGKLPGRPMVEPYLHGVSEWTPPETHVAWREEVELITGELLQRYRPAELLEDYPLKPHELLRDNSTRVFDRLKKLKAPPETPLWIVSEDEVINTTLGELVGGNKEAINYRTVLLPPSAGGLTNGMLSDNAEPANDVADELFDRAGQRRRMRIWSDDETYDAKTVNMRLIRRIELSFDDDEDGSSWCWFELPAEGDTDGSKTNKKPVLWAVHTEDVVCRTREIVSRLPLSDDMKKAIVVAAKFHDLGKKRKLFQRMLGNIRPDRLLAKSGRKGGRLPETYRHEFGSLIDARVESEFLELSKELQELVLHLIAAHHGRGRPHFPPDEAFDPEPRGYSVDAVAAEVPQRYARLQRKYGRWGLAYLESLLRAADYAASACPSRYEEE